MIKIEKLILNGMARDYFQREILSKELKIFMKMI
jgi:hypothetical protein